MWFFKVRADVTCFVGDPDYAKPLVDHVRAQFSNASLSADDNVVIVGHSLGSSICLSSLLDRYPVFPSAAHVFLVTLGSPITRLLGRFFPGIMPDADSAAAQLSALYRDFRWINVYRPFDPIGGAIFSHAKSPLTHDMSTRQYGKVLLTAHTGYWDDAVVIDAVYAAIGEFVVSDQQSRPPADYYDLPDNGPPRVQLPLRLGRFLGTSVWFRAAVALAVVSLVSINATLLIHHGMTASNTPRLARVGVATDDAWLYRYYETNPNVGRPEAGSHAQMPVDFYVVAFRPTGAVRQVASRVDPLAVRSRLDSVFASKGQVLTIKQRGGLFDMPATRVQIRVRYLPDDPTVFDFPTLRPKSAGDSAIYETEAIWYILLLLAVILCPVLLWVVPLYFGVSTKVPLGTLFD